MDDVLEILVENGELPPSAVGDAGVVAPVVDVGYTTSNDSFSPHEVLTDDLLGDTHVRDSLAADELQRELDDIQNEIMNHVDLHPVQSDERCNGERRAPDIDADLGVDILNTGDFHPDFVSDPNGADDDFFESLLSGATDDGSHVPMDVGEDQSERTVETPLASVDILDHVRTGFDYMDDLSLPSFPHDEHHHHDSFERRPCELDLKECGIDIGPSAAMDSEGYDYMDTEMIPNMFGRGHVPQCDPLLGGVLSRPAPRPAHKHYSWERIEYDAT